MTAAPQARTVGFQPGERNVFFHLLTACNLRCRHCYINPAEHGTATLPLATVQRWLKLFARPEQQTNLILLGGEPTLHPDLAAIIRAAKSLRYAVTVDSNGYLFHDLLDRVTPQELDYLSFSLDGPDAAVNDPIRGEGVFAVCTANLRRAVRRRAPRSRWRRPRRPAHPGRSRARWPARSQAAALPAGSAAHAISMDEQGPGSATHRRRRPTTGQRTSKSLVLYGHPVLHQSGGIAKGSMNSGLASLVAA